MSKVSFLYDNGTNRKDYCRTICKSCESTDTPPEKVKCINCKGYLYIVHDTNDREGRKDVDEKIEELKQRIRNAKGVS